MTARRFTCLLLVLLTCQKIVFPVATTTNQADKLYNFIKSRKSENLLDAESWAELDRAVDKDYSLVYVRDQYGLMEVDKLDTLPGQPEGVNFNQYAGYVTIDPKAGRALFYYCVESPENSSTNPLVLWLNGGKTDPNSTSILE